MRRRGKQLTFTITPVYDVLASFQNQMQAQIHNTVCPLTTVFLFSRIHMSSEVIFTATKTQVCTFILHTTKLRLPLHSACAWGLSLFQKPGDAHSLFSLVFSPRELKQEYSQQGPTHVVCLLQPFHLGGYKP